MVQGIQIEVSLNELITVLRFAERAGSWRYHDINTAVNHISAQISEMNRGRLNGNV